AAAGQQHHGHGQGVGRRDPLHVGVRAAEIAADEGRGDVGDRRVQQVHQGGGQRRGERQPAPAVGGGGGAHDSSLLAEQIILFHILNVASAGRIGRMESGAAANPLGGGKRALLEQNAPLHYD